MAEIPLRIPVEGGRIELEALFQEGTAGRNVILCHPHPLYGGSMENNVVAAARRAFAARGWGTLRFNFRGVGASGGQPGQAQQEAEDLLVVSEYLQALHPGTLDLAGYSYGAWTSLASVRLGLAPDILFLFSPPLDFLSFAGLELPDRPVFIALGNEDEFCSVDSLCQWLAGQRHASGRVSLEILPYGDHFYWKKEEELCSKIERFLGRCFPAA